MFQSSQSHFFRPLLAERLYKERKHTKKIFLGASEESSYTNYLAQARQKMTTRESIQESQRMKQFLLFWTADMNPELESKHYGRSCNGLHCTMIPLMAVSLSYCFWWTLSQETAIKSLWCRSSHNLWEPLGEMMKTNIFPASEKHHHSSGCATESALMLI